MSNHTQPYNLKHSEEDEITKLLVGFANDLLAYDERMTKAGSDTLFIHDYVARRKKRFEAYRDQYTQRLVLEGQIEALRMAKLEKEIWPNVDTIGDLITQMQSQLDKLKEEK